MRQPLFVQPVALETAWNNPEENLSRVEAAVRSGLAQNPNIPSEARLFVFPELTLTGFVTESPAAWDRKHPFVERLRRIASGNKTALVAGFPERNPAAPKRPFNASALIGPDGRMLSVYRKMHLFTAGKSPESAVYSRGASAVLCAYRGWKIGFSVCFDVRFSALYHRYALSGADLIVVSSCWIGGPHKSYQYKTLGSAHAILSQAYVAAVNQAGRDPYCEYDGSRYVFSPFGENLHEGAPTPLEAAQLEACRKLQVRTADRPAYPIRAYKG